MITALDTNILFDILLPDPIFSGTSESALTESLLQGSLVISEVVYAELAAHFSDLQSLDRFLEDTQVQLERSSRQSLFLAGALLRQFRERQRNVAQIECPRCGGLQPVICTHCGTPIRSNQHVLADFVVGAHALVQADRLLTRDRGYFRAYFPDLRLA